MKRSFRKANWYLAAAILLLSWLSAKPQSAEGDRFLGKWISDKTSSGAIDASYISEEPVVLEIERRGKDFKITLTSQSGQGDKRMTSVRESTFEFLTFGQLIRRESIAKTWEPSEFPESVTEMIAISKNGKKLVLSATYHSSERIPLLVANRKSLSFAMEFKKAGGM